MVDDVYAERDAIRLVGAEDRASTLMATYLRGVNEMVRARTLPMEKALVRVMLVDGIPTEDCVLESHHEDGDRWRDVLRVRGKLTYEVRSGWDGPAFKVVGQWLDGRDLKVTAHG